MSVYFHLPEALKRFDRRQFLKTGGAGGAALVIGFRLPSLREMSSIVAPEARFAPNAFLEINSSGAVTIWTPKSEMGQGVRTSLPMLVAEELDADWSAVRVLQADFDPRFGDQTTGGSYSVRGEWEPLRKAAAAARAMLLSAAAQTWSVPQTDCRAEYGFVLHAPTGRRLSYGQLAEKATTLPTPQDAPLKDPKDFRLIGKPVARTDVPAKVDGSAVFGLDVRVPGMLYASVARCPTFGGGLRSFNAEKAKARKGVRDVFEIPRFELLQPFENIPGGPGHANYVPSGVAVVADSTWAALEGRRALEVQWDEGPYASQSTASLHDQFERLARGAGTVIRNVGDAERALTSADRKLEAIYEVPFLAHATMEPMNCTADVRANRCEIWAPTQVPGAVAGSVANALKRPLESIQVHVTFLGGGFGRRLVQDFAVEAALISRAARAPVKVTWTREDDLQHDYYRPASYHRLWAGLDAQGNPVAWMHRAVSPSIGVFFRGTSIPPAAAAEVNGPDFPSYAIPNFRLEFARAESAVPLGFWRSVENSANIFVVESFFDEIAAAAGHDPVALRRKLFGAPRRIKMGDSELDLGRLSSVMDLAAAKAGWGTPLPKGRGRGIAVFFGYGSYVAQVAEVSVGKDRAVRVNRVVCAVDCGQVVNPDTVAAQMVGGIVFGLTAALKGAITLEAGRVQQSNFHDYPMLRINEMPAVEVHIIPSREPVGGTGEPGVPPIGPAVCNAIFAATGKRIRRLPIRAQDLV